MTTALESQVEARVRDDRYDEVWDGELVMAPMPNRDHQSIATRLSRPLLEVVEDVGVGLVYAGLNVSDRAEDWRGNFRCPNVAVYLATNPAAAHEAHMQGGPDFAVEVLSQGEDPEAKLGFYASIGTRELLVIDRAGGWVLELFRLAGGVLTLAGSATPGGPGVLSETVGLTFRLEAGEARPAIVVGHPASGRAWRA